MPTSTEQQKHMEQYNEITPQTQKNCHRLFLKAVTASISALYTVQVIV